MHSKPLDCPKKAVGNRSTVILISQAWKNKKGNDPIKRKKKQRGSHTNTRGRGRKDLFFCCGIGTGGKGGAETFWVGKCGEGEGVATANCYCRRGTSGQFHDHWR